MSHVLRLIPIAALALLAAVVQAAAQTYPDRVVRIINPYPPGGSVDITARILAQKLSDNTGHQFIVENRGGAGGNTGADAVAKSEPDGYTLLFTAPPPLAINQTLYTKGLPFDPAKDFVPIGTFALTPIVLMVHPGIRQGCPGADRVRKSQSGQGPLRLGRHRHHAAPLRRAVQEHGEGRDRACALPRTGPAMNDLIGGHIQMFFDLLPASLPQINGGKVRALANAGAKRPAALPDLPTVAEQGLPGFDSASWVALAAPSKTPAPVVAKLREEVGKVLVAPDIVARIRELGSEPGTVNEKDVRAFLDAETKKWAEVIRLSGAKAD